MYVPSPPYTTWTSSFAFILPQSPLSIYHTFSPPFSHVAAFDFLADQRRLPERETHVLCRRSLQSMGLPVGCGASREMASNIRCRDRTLGSLLSSAIRRLARFTLQAPTPSCFLSPRGLARPSLPSSADAAASTSEPRAPSIRPRGRANVRDHRSRKSRRPRKTLDILIGH